MLEGLTGLFLFFSNWLSSVGGVGVIELDEAYKHDERVVIEAKMKFRWDERGNEIVKTGIPVVFHCRAVSKSCSETYIRMLKYNKKHKNYLVISQYETQSDTVGCANIYTSLNELKKVTFRLNCDDNIKIETKLQKVRIKGVTEPIDLSALFGGGVYKLTVDYDTDIHKKD